MVVSAETFHGFFRLGRPGQCCGFGGIGAVVGGPVVPLRRLRAGIGGGREQEGG